MFRSVASATNTRLRAFCTSLPPGPDGGRRRTRKQRSRSSTWFATVDGDTPSACA
jgi:hypothetical protein